MYYRHILVICAFVLSSALSCAYPSSLSEQSVKQYTDSIFDELVKIRRDFHQHPEVSNKEIRTAKKIAAYLSPLGFNITSGIGGHSVVAVLDTEKKGKHITWRADIDAMPSDIPDVVDFPSKYKGVRHICGHDINTTIALGIAKVMAEHKEQLSGTISFIFQPAEESYTGAKAMVEDGLFTLIQPDEIYGSHIAPMPAHVISTKPKWMFADYKTVEIIFKNSNNKHALIEFAKERILALQNVADDSPFWQPKNLGDPKIGLTSKHTIFTNFLFINQNSFEVIEENNQIRISAYLGASSQKLLDNIIPSLKEEIRISPYANKLIDVHFSFERANVNNNITLTKEALAHISQTFGNDSTVLLHGEMPDYRGDDFAYFQQHVPGVYFYLGGSNFAKGIISMPHAPNFQVDENAIKTGVNYFSSLIIHRLQAR